MPLLHFCHSFTRQWCFGGLKSECFWKCIQVNYKKHKFVKTLTCTCALRVYSIILKAFWIQHGHKVSMLFRRPRNRSGALKFEKDLEKVEHTKHNKIPIRYAHIFPLTVCLNKALDSKELQRKTTQDSSKPSSKWQTFQNSSRTTGMTHPASHKRSKDKISKIGLSCINKGDDPLMILKTLGRMFCGIVSQSWKRLEDCVQLNLV